MNEVAVEKLSASAEEAAWKREAEFQAVVKAGTNLPDLIERLCPDGVPFVVLSVASDLVRERVEMKKLSRENYTGVENLLQNCAGRTNATTLPETNAVEVSEGDVLLGNIRPYLRKAWLADRAGGASGDVLVIRRKREWRERINPSFLYYLLTSEDFFSYFSSTARGGKMPRGDKKAVMKWKIPVPPVGVQEEIVRILDLMTELEAEMEAVLEAVLEARRLQYAHYRDALLSFTSLTDFERERERESLSDEWQRVTLGELGTFIKGSGIQKSDLKDEGYPAIHYGQLHTCYGLSASSTVSFIDTALFKKAKKAHFGDILLATTSENDDDVAKPTVWLGEEEVAISGDATIFRPQCDSRFLAHFFVSELFRKQKNRLISGTKVRRMSVSALEKVFVDLPSEELQKSIAGVLDQMDALVNDLTSGLPAELEARRKQYAYYRDHLLTFKEKPQM